MNPGHLIDAVSRGFPTETLHISNSSDSWFPSQAHPPLNRKVHCCTSTFSTASRQPTTPACSRATDGWHLLTKHGHYLESDLNCLQRLAQTPLAEIAQLHRNPVSRNCRGPDSPPELAASAENGGQAKPPWDLSESRLELEARFREAEDWGTLVEPMMEFVRTHGAGIFQGTPAFSLTESGTHLTLKPIPDFDDFSLDWWQGDYSKIETLMANTEHLLCGLPAHNVLIWGPRGCGKSSLIRGLITRHYARGLRGIQIPPHLHGRLSEIYPLVRDRPERFVGVLDNISLDSRTSTFRQLASVLDGGLERPPQNLVFYGTSNFKDLVDRGRGQACRPASATDGWGLPGAWRRSHHDFPTPRVLRSPTARATR